MVGVQPHIKFPSSYQGVKAGGSEHVNLSLLIRTKECPAEGRLARSYLLISSQSLTCQLP